MKTRHQIPERHVFLYGTYSSSLGAVKVKPPQGERNTKRKICTARHVDKWLSTKPETSNSNTSFPSFKPNCWLRRRTCPTQQGYRLYEVFQSVHARSARNNEASLWNVRPERSRRESCLLPETHSVRRKAKRWPSCQILAFEWSSTKQKTLSFRFDKLSLEFITSPFLIWIAVLLFVTISNGYLFCWQFSR